MRHVRYSLAGGGVDRNYFIMIGDDEVRSISEYQVGNAFVGAFVLPQNLSIRRINRRDAIRPAIDDLAVFQTRELSAGARVKHTASKNQLRGDAQVFGFPFHLAG